MAEPKPSSDKDEPTKGGVDRNTADGGVGGAKKPQQDQDAGGGKGQPDAGGQETGSPVLSKGVHDRVDGGNTSGGAALDFSDDDIASGRGNTSRMGGTYAAQGADSGKLAPPSAGLSDSNGPSDPD